MLAPPSERKPDPSVGNQTLALGASIAPLHEITIFRRRFQNPYKISLKKGGLRFRLLHNLLKLILIPKNDNTAQIKNHALPPKKLHKWR
jgi:hypothetical protein